jgi:hypothetical protein
MLYKGNPFIHGWMKYVVIVRMSTHFQLCKLTSFQVVFNYFQNLNFPPTHCHHYYMSYHPFIHIIWHIKSFIHIIRHIKHSFILFGTLNHSFILYATLNHSFILYATLNHSFILYATLNPSIHN